MKRIHALQTSRVKCLDFHKTQPLLLVALYNGDALIVDVNRGSIVKTFQVHSGVPLRAGRWIPHNGNFVVGGDNRSLLFYSPTKGKLLFDISDAHEGYVRSLAVHPIENLLLSCSDDFTIKLWNISTNCTLIKTFDFHSGLVMDVKWNPRENNTFASCSMDGTVVFWDISSDQPRFTQKIGVKCVNTISFASLNDRPLVAAGSDDKIIHIWDIQSRSIVSKLESHDSNITRAEFHPTRPIIVTTAEDNLTIVWSSSTFKKENSLSSAMERGWAISFSSFLPLMAIGHDKGISLHKFKHIGTPMSLDSNGKLVIAKGTEISFSNIKNMNDIIDGSELQLTFKEAITTEWPSISLYHSPNGKYITACGESEWIVFSSLGFRSRCFGKGIGFAWCNNSTSFATINSLKNIEIHISFDEIFQFNIFAQKIWGGELLSISTNNGLEFYDWENQKLIRRIEIKPREVSWFNNFVAIRTKNTIYILNYNNDYESIHDPSSGYTDSFSIICEIEAKANSMYWANGILIYSEGTKISRIVTNIIQPITSLKIPSDIIGYLPRENLIVLADQQRNIIGSTLSSSLLQFEASVAEGDDPDPSLVPDLLRTRTAKFLKQIGKLELALTVAVEPSMKFDIAIEVGDLDIAKSCAKDSAMWRRLARASLVKGEINLAIESLKKCGDFSTLLILLKLKGTKEDLISLLNDSENCGQLNVAFSTALLLKDFKKCIELLIKSNKFAEATLFARSNFPELTNECLNLWKNNLPNKKIANSLADPIEFPNLFDELNN